MCQSIAEGGKRCAAHNRSDEMKRARNRISALSTQIEETEYRLERAREDAEMLREDADRAPDDEGARLNAQLAEREVKELEQLLSDQRMDLECEQMVAGLTDTRERPGYRDEVLAALPDGANTDVLVDGRYVPAAQVTDELIEAQKAAAAASGEAKRLRRVEDDEDAAALEEDKASHFRERAARLAGALRGALGDGVMVAADGIRAVGGVASDFVDATIGETLRGAEAAAVEAVEGAAASVGINTDTSAPRTEHRAHVTSPDHREGTATGSADGDDRALLTRAERAAARETAEARRIADADPEEVEEVTGGWSPEDGHTTYTVPGSPSLNDPKPRRRAHPDAERAPAPARTPVTGGNAQALHAPSRATHESRTGRERMAPSPATLVTTTPRGGVVLDIPAERAPRMFSLASLSRARRAKRDPSIDTEADQWAASLSDDELRSLLEDIRARGGW